MLTGKKHGSWTEGSTKKMLALPDCKHPLKLITQENLQNTGVSKGKKHTCILTHVRDSTKSKSWESKNHFGNASDRKKECISEAHVLGWNRKNSIIKRAGFDQQVERANNRLLRNFSLSFLDYPFFRKEWNNLKQIFRFHRPPW